MNIKNIYLRLIVLGDDPDDSHMVELQAHIDAPDDQAAMLTAFRHAANDLGIEAGVVASHKAHGGLSGDHYFLELISASQQGMRRLSVRYERLRAAALPVLDDYKLAIDALEHESPGDGVESQEWLDDLQEALSDGIPVTVCTECTQVYEAHRTACPYCQHDGTFDSLAIESNQTKMNRVSVFIMTAAINAALALPASRSDEINHILRRALKATEMCRDES
jgi:sulfur relay (sulfurtransferase) complex TusBCD TusD component (DsrE family)